MKKTTLWTLGLLLGLSASTMAQTDLTGRVYHNDNIIKALVSEESGELDAKLKELEPQAIAKAEKEKGRPLTDKEKETVKKEVNEAKAKAIAAQNALKIAITVEFNSSTQAVMRNKITVDEAALKAVGVGWLKRKALKTAIALAPEKEKSNYVVKGNLVIMGEGKDLDTLRLSPDGQTLSGRDDKREFKLKRIK